MDITSTFAPPRGLARRWYRHALASGTGSIRASGIERDVAFGEADASVHDAVDSACYAKYDRYGPGPVSHVTGPGRPSLVTIRLVRSEP